MDKKIIICVGISGSGKSTWATKFLKENHNFLRINRDDIRKVLVGDLNGYYQRSDLNDIERFINKIETDLYTSINYNHRNIIIDNTNLKQQYINKWIDLAEDDYYDIKFKLFDIELDQAKYRVHCRETVKDSNSLYKTYAYEEAQKDLSLNYIDKQYEDYKKIKEYLLTHYKDKIIL